MAAWHRASAHVSGRLLAAAVWLVLGTMPVAAQTPRGIVGHVAQHVVRPGETGASLGARWGVEAAALLDANQKRRNAPLHVGETLRIDSRHIVPETAASLVINIPQRMVFLTDGTRVLAYPVGLGRPNWQTPVGPFTVVQKERNPTWDVPRSIQDEMRRAGRPVLQRVPPGPSNPLGAYFIRLSLPNLGLHGTIAPQSIYHFQSHGCVRLHPDDVAVLFDRVEVGAAGTIVYEPVLATVQDGRAYLEVHPDVYKRAPDAAAAARSRLTAAGAASVDWRRVSEVVKKRAGTVEDVTMDLPGAGAASSAITGGEDRR
jgi:L,D-transpeptidase ErfK/SrfK